ncbi:MAG TPA: DNRLRE domain-containing protein [Kofleriaceae bacterium]|nr:DNRLRE domain-containing protein [Kofleriaceae bacterium]
MWRWVLVGLCACRIGFDELPASDASDTVVTTVTFGERPTSQHKNVTRDATVLGRMGNANFGDLEDLSISEYMPPDIEHSLLRFDLSSIAPATRVVAARLTLARVDYGDEMPGQVDVLLVGESWTEGNGMSGSGVSWNTRDGTIAWTQPGGTTTMLLTQLVPPATTFTIELDPSIVQNWIDVAANNDGVAIRVPNSSVHYHFHARNSAMAARRPELAIDLAE